jgi:hypothetical protein
MTDTQTTKQGDKVTIKGINYIVEAIHTVKEIRERGLNRVADEYAQNRIIADLIIKRPNGAREHFARLHDCGGITYVTAL